MSVNYNHTAWFYDKLAKLVYGTTLLKAQCYFLDHIRPHSTLLIVGGGSGELLEHLAAKNLAGMQIIYIEMSTKMIARAKKRKTHNLSIHFINQPIENCCFDEPIDMVLTPFLFGSYTQQEFVSLFHCISPHLQPNTYWINTDFQVTGALWQKCLLAIMYRFFRLFTSIKTTSLPSIHATFHNSGFRIKQQKEYFRKFVVTQLWIR